MTAPENPVTNTADWRLRSREEFAEYLETTLAGTLADLDAERRTVARKARSIIALGISLAPVTGLLVFAFLRAAATNSGKYESDRPGLLGMAVLAAILTGVAVSYFGYILKTADFREKFKAKVISPLVRFFGDDFTYLPDHCIDDGHFLASRLFNQDSIDRYGGEDLIKGTAGKTAFGASEIQVEEVTVSKDEDTGNVTRGKNIVFKGLFFVGEFNKQFSGATFVVPHREMALYRPG